MKKQATTQFYTCMESFAKFD